MGASAACDESAPTFESEVASILAHELKSHLVSIESKVDEISIKVDRGLGSPLRPPSSALDPKAPPSDDMDSPDMQACDSISGLSAASVMSSARGALSSARADVDRAPAVPAWASPQNMNRRKSIQAMRRLSMDVSALGVGCELPGSAAADGGVLRGQVSMGNGCSPMLRATKSQPDISERGNRRPSVEAVKLGKLRSRMNWANEDSLRSVQKSSRRLMKSNTQELQAAKETCLWSVVHGMPFQILTSVIIVLNALYIGVRADLRVTAELENKAESPVMGYIEITFFFFFAVELALRMVTERKFFIVGPEWKWNVFDTLLVVFSILDAIMNGLTSGGVANVTTARMVRIVRFVRIIRIARAVRAFHRLRIVVFAIFESIISLLWCFVVVCLIIYVFAVLFLHGVHEHLADPTVERPEMLLPLYGSVYTAMVTLFMSITGGVDWRESMIPLKAMHWVYEPIFNFYIFFMVIGVLNVVVGAFVATTAEISSKDREVLVKAEINNLDTYQKKIKTFFYEADKDKSGTLSWDEFKAHLKIPKVSAYFRALELDVSQAHMVFKLLDQDGSDEVSLDEFLAGCLRLKGQAKSLDVNLLLFENQRLFDRLTEFLEVTADLLLKDKAIDPEEAKRIAKGNGQHSVSSFSPGSSLVLDGELGATWT